MLKIVDHGKRKKFKACLEQQRMFAEREIGLKKQRTTERER